MGDRSSVIHPYTERCGRWVEKTFALGSWRNLVICCYLEILHIGNKFKEMRNLGATSQEYSPLQEVMQVIPDILNHFVPQPMALGIYTYLFNKDSRILNDIDNSVSNLGIIVYHLQYNSK